MQKISGVKNTLSPSATVIAAPQATLSPAVIVPPLQTNLSHLNDPDLNNSETFDYVPSHLTPGSLAELSANSQDITNVPPPAKSPNPEIQGKNFPLIHVKINFIFYSRKLIYLFFSFFRS
jgi:hypothetical protein